jgi:hypothetical protein
VYFDDLDGAKQYERWDRYGHSKLCNILHARVRIAVVVPLRARR